MVELFRYKSETSPDSVKQRKAALGEKQDIALLEECATLWENLRPMRRRRQRALRFIYGDQWGDKITVNGRTMTQREYISRVGNVALQANQVKKIVNTVAGVWAKEHNEPVCNARDRAEQQYGELMTTTLQANWQRNKMNVMMVSALEEMLAGGLCIARETYERRNQRTDTWTDVVNPNDIFMASEMKDPRFWDLQLIGQRHEISFNEFCAAFAKNPEDYKKFREWYIEQDNPQKYHDGLDASDMHNEKDTNFREPRDSKNCLVIEVWTKERKPRYHVWDKNSAELYDIDADDREELERIRRTNEERKANAPADWSKDEVPLIETHFFMDTYWYYRFLTPQGYIISEGESPLPDRDHPYSVCAIPFTNGMIVSYLHDAIDLNIAINRILTLDDWVKRTGAKGITFVPENLIPDDMDYRTFAEQWTSIDGIVYYKPNKNGDMPKTFYGNTGTLQTAEIVRMMKDLMDSAEVSGAIQGKTPYAGTSAALYAQQTQNSSTPIATLLEKFNMFVESVAIKKTKNIKQYYTVDRYMAIAGSVEGLNSDGLNLNETGEIEYDLSIKQSTETPVYRMMANDYLTALFDKNAITLEDLLSLSTLPFADKLLQRIQARQQEMAAQAGGMPPVQQQGYEEKKRAILGNQEGNT